MSEKAQNNEAQSPKRKATDAGLPVSGARPHKSVKRRASKACQCCRARKVRCNVVEQTPCTNCRLDEVECIVSESKRKKFVNQDGGSETSSHLPLARKWSKAGDNDRPDFITGIRPGGSNASAHSPSSINGAGQQNISFQDSPGHHVPHVLCKSDFFS